MPMINAPEMIQKTMFEKIVAVERVHACIQSDEGGECG